MLNRPTSAEKETLFNEVYQSARDLKTKKLTKIIETNLTINIFQGPYSVVRLLAQQGYIEPVELLTEKYGASLHEAALGYAAADLENKVKDLLKEGANINAAVQGYAEAGLIDKVEKLLTPNADINAAVKGYAQAGLTEKVNELEDKVKGQPAHGDLIVSAVHGFAKGGHSDQVKKFIKKSYSIKKPKLTSLKAEQQAAFNYGITKQISKVNYQVADGGLVPQLKAAYGFAAGGHLTIVINYLHSQMKFLTEDYKDYYDDRRSKGVTEDAIKRHVDHTNRARRERVENVVKGLAKAGLMREIENLFDFLKSSGVTILLDKSMRNFAYEQYAKTGHIFQGIPPEFDKKKIEQIAKRYKENHHTPNQLSTLRILTFTHRSIRKKLAQHLPHYEKTPEETLRTAAKLNQLMYELDLGFGEALSFMRPWMMPELHIFFLQGIALVRDNKIPLDIFLHIASYLISLPDNKTYALFQKHFTVMPGCLFNATKASLEEKAKKLGHTLDMYQPEIKEAEARRDKRLIPILC